MNEHPYQVTMLYSNDRIYRKVGAKEYHANPVTRFPNLVDIHDEVWEWCEANLKGEWYWVPLNLPNRDPQGGRMLMFTEAHDALLFKLRWA